MNTMTAPTPTPNQMPGAQQPTPNPQLQEPIPTGTPPAQQQPQQQPQPPAQNPPESQAPQQPAKSSDDGKPPMTLEAWREIARKNEARARENEDKAKKWEEAEALRRTKEENQAIEIAKAQEEARAAREEAARERVARETGVLPQLLGGGTEEDMRAAAQVALEWRGPQAQTPPPPQTAAVPASTVTSGDKMGHGPNTVPQLTREQFVALPPNERMRAVREGQCTDLGIGKPHEQRRMGNQLDLGAHAGKA
jgi:hypothetical protein